MMAHLNHTSKLKTATRPHLQKGKKEKMESFIWRKQPGIHSAQVVMDEKH